MMASLLTILETTGLAYENHSKENSYKFLRLLKSLGIWQISLLCKWKVRKQAKDPMRSGRVEILLSFRIKPSRFCRSSKLSGKQVRLLLDAFK